MRIHCPRCGSEVELVSSLADSVVTCARCTLVFDPRSKDTVPQGEAPELLPGVRAGEGFGPYVLERRIGKGGMGQVFIATQLSLGRKVALKVLAPELLQDPAFVRRFDAEARALAALNHANIVQVIDKGIEKGHSYLVMEYVDGVALRDLLNEKKLPAKDALAIVPQLCDALEYAHARGVVHRDIKPENILIARDGTPKIADFGLARIVGMPDRERITRSNVIMGSLDYMAPEQRERAKEADHRADIYALGVVFYEMLTGELPIGRFDPPSKKAKLEVDIDEVVLRVLSKDPEMRYQRASEVGMEIRRRVSAGQGGAPAWRLADRLAEQAKHPWRAPIALGAASLIFLGGTLSERRGDEAVFTGLIAGGLGAGSALFAIWNGLFAPISRGAAQWLRFPLVIGLAVLTWVILPRPFDAVGFGAIFVSALAVWSNARDRLVEPERKKEPKDRPHDRPTVPQQPPAPEREEEKKDMRVTIEPGNACEARIEKSVRDVAERSAGAAAEGLAAAVAAVPPPPAKRPRLSIVALLGFIMGTGVFVVGALLAALSAYAASGGYALLDEIARTDPRAIATFTLDAPAGTVVPTVWLACVLALIAAALVGIWNLAGFALASSKAGKRGRGLALLGACLTLVGLGLGAKAVQPAQDAGARWREASTSASIGAAHGEALERLLAMNAFHARNDDRALEGLVRAVREDGSVAVRLAATAGLGAKLFEICHTPSQPTEALQAKLARRRALVEDALRAAAADPVREVADMARKTLDGKWPHYLVASRGSYLLGVRGPGPYRYAMEVEVGGRRIRLMSADYEVWEEMPAEEPAVR